MVARKPVPENAPTNAGNTVEQPRIEIWSATDSEVDSEQIWGTREQPSATHQQTNTPEGTDASQQVPDPLRPDAVAVGTPYGQDEQNPWDEVENGVSMPVKDGPAVKLDAVPDVLRPGVARHETNPFKRKPVQSPPGSPTSAQTPNMPTVAAPKPQPSPQSLSQVYEPGTNPWRPALNGVNISGTTQPPVSLLDQDPDDGNVWSSTPQLKTSPGITTPQSTGNTQSTSSSSHAPVNAAAVQDLLGDRQAWEGEQSASKGKQPAVSQVDALAETIDGWNLVDHESTPEPAPGSLSKQSTWENFVDAEDDTAKEVVPPETEAPPALPPRTSLDAPPVQPPRRQSPSNVNMSETYQIKNINWHDPRAAKNPRKSPILVQNANGPCPLVALVNALTLTTPADQSHSNLVDTLSSREQISLSFLLEVVVDELMSFRHTETDPPLPDMSELYGFLQGLHTGMNVNPRFIPNAEAVAIHKRKFPSPAHSSDSVADIPGTFEKTRDMELYATFRVPLIHGWLPLGDDMVLDALKSRASSYDDAQNLLFHEEELEDKLSNSQTGLTEEEQQLYQDLIIIKSFLASTATQLTPSGLDVITRSIGPGEISILFRNDHFSTLYRHPHSLQLFTLVTDAGYFTHDEVVWESLVDVRGERAEFFSGDFRVVGGNQLQRAGGSRDAWPSSAAGSTSNEGGWQTVQNRRSNNNRRSEPDPAAAPISPQHEQEDRDLALALQLQEEEEERHRAEQAARRRESRLSEQFIEQQGRDGTGSRNRGGSVSSTNRGSSHSLSPRGNSVSAGSGRGAAAVAAAGARVPMGARGARTGQQVRSLIPPRTHRPENDTLEDAPPSYEQAAKSTPYIPPAGHPSHPDSNQASPNPSLNPLPSPHSNPNPRTASSLRSQGNAGPSTPARTPRHSAASVTAGGGSGGGGKERDCCVM
ncbi:hypothetical protein F4777DRAFT_478235 [Nemania sp. FL0916]|nr:hypothetical protein F4777DRAFT_478235 [Nemania sp. FL0916]